MYDFAYPKDNEEKLLLEYYKNKIKNVVLCYEVFDKEDLSIFKLNNMIYFKRLNVFYCAIVNNEDPKKSLEISNELFYSEKYYNDLIFIRGRDLNFNEYISRKYFYNGVYDFVSIDKKYKFNGLSYKSIKIMKNNKLSFLFSISNIKKDISKFYAIKEFIKFGVKKDLKLIIGSFASKGYEVPDRYQILSFYKILKIPWSIKYMEKILFEQIERTRLAKKRDYFTKGFYIISYPYQDCREF